MMENYINGFLSEKSKVKADKIQNEVILNKNTKF